MQAGNSFFVVFTFLSLTCHKKGLAFFALFCLHLVIKRKSYYENVVEKSFTVSVLANDMDHLHCTLRIGSIIYILHDITTMKCGT